MAKIARVAHFARRHLGVPPQSWQTAGMLGEGRPPARCIDLTSNEDNVERPINNGAKILPPLISKTKRAWSRNCSIFTPEETSAENPPDNIPPTDGAGPTP